MTDQEIIEFVKQWAPQNCGCVAGKRELSKNRYTILVVRSKEQVMPGYEKFLEDLRARLCRVHVYLSA